MSGSDWLEALVAPAGAELLGRLAGEVLTPETELRVGARLRRDYPAELVSAALAQHELRRHAREKFTRAERMFFTRAGLEQATAEVVARHRAARFAGVARVGDLCCGIGGDLIALASQQDVIAVDRDPLHLRMAMLNAEAYAVAEAVTAVHADVREVDLRDIDAVFVDPARRTQDSRTQGSRTQGSRTQGSRTQGSRIQGSRTQGSRVQGSGAQGSRMRAGASEPPLSWATSLVERVAAVGIKAAPGIARDAVPPGWEVEFIADRRNLKEAALWSPALATATSRATILPAGHMLLPLPGHQVQHRDPGAFLLDPNPAVTRAGLVEDLARGLGAWKIDPQIAFLSSDVALRTPFARTLRVLDSRPWDQKALPSRLWALDIGSVDIRRRGLAGNVENLHRRLKLRGTRRATLVMTRVEDRPWALICVDLPPPTELLS